MPEDRAQTLNRLFSLSLSVYMRMLLRFHDIATQHPEWPPVTLAEAASDPVKYAEVLDVMMPEFASMRLQGEI